MAKLINPKYAGDYFNEAFLSTLDRERKLQEQRQQFQREMGFRNRQLDLLDAYRQSQIDINQQHADIRAEDLAFRKNQPLVVDDKVIGRVDGKYDFENPLYQPDPKISEIERQGNLLLEKTTQGENVDYSQLGYVSAGDSEGSGTDNIEPFNPILKQWQVEKGLNILQTPSFEDKKGKKSVKDIEIDLNDGMNNLTSAYFTHNMRNQFAQWRNDYGRYPNPNELIKEINEEGKTGNITPEEKERYNAFLDIYYQAYGGINQMQRRIINPKSFEIKEK